MRAWPVKKLLVAISELRKDQREIVISLFYHRSVARLTDDKEPMYRALRVMNQALITLRKGGFTDKQWPIVQQLMDVVNKGRRDQRIDIHAEESSFRNQRNADRRSKISASDLRRAWLDLEGKDSHKARRIAVQFGDDPENILRRIRDWRSKKKLPNA